MLTQVTIALATAWLIQTVTAFAMLLKLTDALRPMLATTMVLQRMKMALAITAAAPRQVSQ
jgi:hypothetical protein